MFFENILFLLRRMFEKLLLGKCGRDFRLWTTRIYRIFRCSLVLVQSQHTNIIKVDSSSVRYMAVFFSKGPCVLKNIQESLRHARDSFSLSVDFLSGLYSARRSTQCSLPKSELGIKKSSRKKNDYSHPRFFPALFSDTREIKSRPLCPFAVSSYHKLKKS